MKNRYYGLRHGESTANVKGIVVSDPAVGTIEYGLTVRGREQVTESVRNAALDSTAKIHCSDFLRARETAEMAAELLGCSPPMPDARLRERFFGSWDMKGNTEYETVWALDIDDPSHGEGGVESATAVCDRLRSFIASMEAVCEDETIVIVSHGDPLQLLQTVFDGRSPSEHRQLEHWGTAELRRLG